MPTQSVSKRQPARPRSSTLKPNCCNSCSSTSSKPWGQGAKTKNRFCFLLFGAWVVAWVVGAVWVRARLCTTGVPLCGVCPRVVLAVGRGCDGCRLRLRACARTDRAPERRAIGVASSLVESSADDLRGRLRVFLESEDIKDYKF